MAAPGAIPIVAHAVNYIAVAAGIYKYGTWITGYVQDVYDQAAGAHMHQDEARQVQKHDDVREALQEHIYDPDSDLAHLLSSAATSPVKPNTTLPIPAAFVNTCSDQMNKDDLSAFDISSTSTIDNALAPSSIDESSYSSLDAFAIPSERHPSALQQGLVPALLFVFFAVCVTICIIRKRQAYSAPPPVNSESAARVDAQEQHSAPEEADAKDTSEMGDVEGRVDVEEDGALVEEDFIAGEGDDTDAENVTDAEEGWTDASEEWSNAEQEISYDGDAFSDLEEDWADAEDESMNAEDARSDAEDEQSDSEEAWMDAHEEVEAAQEIDLLVAVTDIPVTAAALPFAEIDLPLAEVDLPFANVDIPLAGADVPLAAVRLPYIFTDLPFAGVDLPLAEVNVPLVAAGPSAPTADILDAVTDRPVVTNYPATAVHLPAAIEDHPVAVTNPPITIAKLPELDAKAEDAADGPAIRTRAGPTAGARDEGTADARVDDAAGAHVEGEVDAHAEDVRAEDAAVDKSAGEAADKRVEDATVDPPIEGLPTAPVKPAAGVSVEDAAHMYGEDATNVRAEPIKDARADDAEVATNLRAEGAEDGRAEDAADARSEEVEDAHAKDAEDVRSQDEQARVARVEDTDDAHAKAPKEVRVAAPDSAHVEASKDARDEAPGDAQAQAAAGVQAGKATSARVDDAEDARVSPPADVQARKVDGVRVEDTGERGEDPKTELARVEDMGATHVEGIEDIRAQLVDNVVDKQVAGVLGGPTFDALVEKVFNERLEQAVEARVWQAVEARVPAIDARVQQVIDVHIQRALDELNAADVDVLAMQTAGVIEEQVVGALIRKAGDASEAGVGHAREGPHVHAREEQVDGVREDQEIAVLRKQTTDAVDKRVTLALSEQAPGAANQHHKQLDDATVAKVVEQANRAPDEVDGRQALDTSAETARNETIRATNERDEAEDAPNAEAEQIPTALGELDEQVDDAALELPAHEALAGDKLDEYAGDTPSDKVTDLEAPAEETEHPSAAQVDDKGSSETTSPATSEFPVHDVPAADAAALDHPVLNALDVEAQAPAEAAVDREADDDQVATTREVLAASAPKTHVANKAPEGQDDDGADDPAGEAPAESALDESAPRAYNELASAVVDGQATRALLAQAGEAPTVEANDQTAPQVNDERTLNVPASASPEILAAHLQVAHALEAQVDDVFDNRAADAPAVEATSAVSDNQVAGQAIKRLHQEVDDALAAKKEDLPAAEINDEERAADIADTASTRPPELTVPAQQATDAPGDHVDNTSRERADEALGELAINAHNEIRTGVVDDQDDELSSAKGEPSTAQANDDRAPNMTASATSSLPVHVVDDKPVFDEDADDAPDGRVEGELDEQADRAPDNRVNGASAKELNVHPVDRADDGDPPNFATPVTFNDPAHADEIRENAGGVPEEQARGEPAKQADNAEVENATETVEAHATDAPKASNDRDVTHAAEPENLPTARIEDGHASKVVGPAPDCSTHIEGVHGISKETVIHAHEPQATDMLKRQATEALNAEATVVFNAKSANNEAGGIDDALTPNNATPTATEPPGDGEDATKRVNEQIPDEHNEAATYRTSRQAHDVPDVEDAEARSVDAKELIVAQVGESRPSHAAALAPLAAHEKQVGQVLGEQAHNEHEEKEVGDASDDQAVAQKAEDLPAAQVDVGRPLNTVTLMGPTLPPVAKQAVDAKSDQYDNAPDAQVVNALSATSADQSAGGAEDAQAGAIAAPATSNNLAPDAHATQAQEERHNGAHEEQSRIALPMKTANQRAEPVDNNQAAQTASSARQEPLARHEEAKDALKDEAEDALKGHTTDNDRLIEPATVKAEDLPTAQARDERPPIVAVPVMSAGRAQVIVHAPATTDNSAAPDGRTMRAAVSAIPEHEVLARTLLRAPPPVVPSARDVFYMPEPAFPREADVFFAPRPYHKLAQPPALPHPPMLPVVQPPTITRPAGMNNLRPDLGRAGEDGGRAQEADLGRPNERVQQIQNADPVGTREGQRLAILAQAEAETIAAPDNALVPDVDPAQALDAQARLDVAAPADAPIEDDVEVGQPGEALDVPDHAMEGDMPEPAAARGMDQKLADGDATNVDHHEVAEVHVDAPVHDDDAVADQGDVEPHNDGTTMPEVNGDANERADAVADEGPPNVAAAQPTGKVQNVSNAAPAIATPITVPPPAPAKDVAPVPAEAPAPAPVNDAQDIVPAPVEVQPRAPTEAAPPVPVAAAALPPPRDATPGGAEDPAPAPAQALHPRGAEQIHAPPATCEESVPKAFKRSTYTKRTPPTPVYIPAQADLLHDPAYGPLLKHILDADTAQATSGEVGGSPNIVDEAPKAAGTLPGNIAEAAKVIAKHEADKHEADEGVKGVDGQMTAIPTAFVPRGPVDPQDAATAVPKGSAQTASDVDLPIASGPASSPSVASTSALPGPSSAVPKPRSSSPFANPAVDAHDAPPTYSGKGKGKAIAWPEEDARLPWHSVGVTSSAPHAASRMISDGWPTDPDLERSAAVDDVAAPLQPQIRKLQHIDSTPPIAGPSRWASMQDLNAGPESSLQRSLSVGNQENRLPGFAVPLAQERARTKTAPTRPAKAARPARNAAPTRTAEPAKTANPETSAAPAKPTNPATTANPTRPTQAARHADDGRPPKGAGRPSGDGRAARGTGRPADDGRAARGMGRPASNGQRQTGKKRR